MASDDGLKGNNNMARLKTFTSRGKGQNFDIYEDIDRVAEHRVDGVATLMIGPSDAKLVFYSIRTMDQPDDKSEGEPIEMRDVNLKISIPTRVLLENCLNILNNMKMNQETLSKARRDEDTKIKEVLDKIHEFVDKKKQH